MTENSPQQSVSAIDPVPSVVVHEGHVMQLVSITIFHFYINHSAMQYWSLFF
jgi:hypothetical protein